MKLLTGIVLSLIASTSIGAPYNFNHIKNNKKHDNDMFCPQQITCRSNVCTPSTLGFSVTWPTPVADDSYDFYQAQGSIGVECDYGSIEQTTLLFSSGGDTHVDMYTHPSSWNRYNDNDWCVSADPKNCPFYHQ